MNKEHLEFIRTIELELCVYRNISQNVRTYIACQFALESKFGKSRLAVEKQNYCGMKTPLVRISTAKNAGEPKEQWADYASYKACVADYILWLQYQKPMNKEIQNVELYQGILKKYCPEKDYNDKINKIYQQLNIKENA